MKNEYGMGNLNACLDQQRQGAPEHYTSLRFLWGCAVASPTACHYQNQYFKLINHIRKHLTEDSTNDSSLDVSTLIPIKNSLQKIKSEEECRRKQARTDKVGTRSIRFSPYTKRLQNIGSKSEKYVIISDNLLN